MWMITLNFLNSKLKVTSNLLTIFRNRFIFRLDANVFMEPCVNHSYNTVANRFYLICWRQQNEITESFNPPDLKNYTSPPLLIHQG